MLIAVWVFPFEFTACEKDSFWCSFAYFTTQSAGKFGTLLIIAITSLLYTIRVTSWRDRIKKFMLSVAALSLFLAAFAFFNEHVLKKALILPRPSHSFIIKTSESTITIDSVYSLADLNRQEFFRNTITNDTVHYKSYDERVLQHWIEESGYSFPSGHTFNAFMLAAVLSFSIYHVRKKWISKLYFLPFAWAIMVGVSRVAIGAHSPLDVSVGAFAGILISHLFIYFDITRKVIIHKHH